MLKVRGTAIAAGLCWVLLAACGGADSIPRYTDIDHFGHVVANAFRASHPEYVVNSGDYAFGRRPDEMAVDLHASPNGESSGAVAAFGIRQDRDSGGFSYTLGGDHKPVPLEEAARRLDTPESRDLSAALRRVGQGGGPAKQDVDAALRRVGRTKEVTAVVELTRPLTVDEIRGRRHLPVTNGVFSPALGGRRFTGTAGSACSATPAGATATPSRKISAIGSTRSCRPTNRCFSTSGWALPG
ncbi:hypothetical protein [Nonomuraea sp. NPDC050691]|uniref:hypothetical protein n=1 Tax=Nonomuraea sp. NPDC050691 TaxID=3155661 RepID=UPI0033FEEBF3